jgi:hypothetical protein
MIHMGYLYIGYERIVCYERKTKGKKGQELVIIFNCCVKTKLNTISSKFYLVVSLDFCNTLGVKLSTKNIIFITIKNNRALVMFGYGKKQQQIKKTSSKTMLAKLVL